MLPMGKPLLPMSRPMLPIWKRLLLMIDRPPFVPSLKGAR